MIGGIAKTVVLSCFRFACNAIYRLACIRSREDVVLFVSRQSNEPTKDFLLVGKEFERRGYEVVYLTRKLSKKTMVSYLVHIAKELRQLARCRVCFLDRYDPVVSLLDFDCEPIVSPADDATLHFEFPCKPIVVQLWHAFGAFKRFGYQSVDTPEGHSSNTAQRFGIHRNYTWVVCTGEGCRIPYAEAFGYPVERVVALGRPEYETLGKLAASPESSSGCMPVVLFAPTLRKNDESPHPFRALYEGGAWKRLEEHAEVIWSFHPLEETGIAPGDVNELLLDADYVVTDYSSIAYEAYLLSKGVLFYEPDIEEYRLSPGLNTDPTKTSPEITFIKQDQLINYIGDLVVGRTCYPKKSLDCFVGDVFSTSDSPVSDIADFIEGKLGRQ